MGVGIFVDNRSERCFPLGIDKTQSPMAGSFDLEPCHDMLAVLVPGH